MRDAIVYHTKDQGFEDYRWYHEEEGAHGFQFEVHSKTLCTAQHLLVHGSTVVQSYSQASAVVLEVVLAGIPLCVPRLTRFLGAGGRRERL